MRFLRLLQYAPYAFFFVCVLMPLGAVAYAIGSIGRTIYSNLIAGWREHQ